MRLFQTVLYTAIAFVFFVAVCSLYAASMGTSIGGSLSANSTAQTVNLEGKKNLYLNNDGTDLVFLEFSTGATATATNTGFSLANQGELSMASEDFVSMSYLCYAGNTATVRYLAWD